MTKRTHEKILQAVIAVNAAAFAAPALAYLDPATGSMIVSAILGILATIGLAVKTYWYKLKSVFKRDSSASGADNPDQESTTTTN